METIGASEHRDMEPILTVFSSLIISTSSAAKDAVKKA